MPLSKGLYSFLKDKNKTSLFISTGCVILLIGIFLVDGFELDLKNLSKEDSFRFWVYSLIRDLGLIILISTMIINGIRSCRINGFKSRAMILLFIGLFLNIGLTIFSGYTYSKLKYISVNLFDNTDKRIQKMLKKLNEKDLSKEMRIPLNRMLAEEYYVKQGKLINLIDKNGQQKAYEPSKEDVEFKEEYDLGKKNMDWLLKSFYRAIYLCSSLLFISVIIGLFLPI